MKPQNVLLLITILTVIPAAALAEYTPPNNGGLTTTVYTDTRATCGDCYVNGAKGVPVTEADGSKSCKPGC